MSNQSIISLREEVAQMLAGLDALLQQAASETGSVARKSANVPAHLRKSSPSKGFAAFSSTPFGKRNPLTFSEYLAREDVQSAYPQAKADAKAQKDARKAAKSDNPTKGSKWSNKLAGSRKVGHVFTYTSKRTGIVSRWQVVGTLGATHVAAIKL